MILWLLALLFFESLLFAFTFRGFLLIETLDLLCFFRPFIFLSVEHDLFSFLQSCLCFLNSLCFSFVPLEFDLLEALFLILLS